jgi:hypothetical protein
MDVFIDYSSSGPIFNGQAPAVIAAYLDDVLTEVGGQGLADVHQILNENIKRPTPYYETQIISQRVSVDQVVHDRGIIYGPWLEGTSTRNQTTRFKGYHAFRNARNNLVAKVPELADHVFQKYLPRLR